MKIEKINPFINISAHFAPRHFLFTRVHRRLFDIMDSFS